VVTGQVLALHGVHQPRGGDGGGGEAPAASTRLHPQVTLALFGLGRAGSIHLANILARSWPELGPAADLTPVPPARE
jgi:hypothetical protein